jgi:hypothetical protein
LVLTVDFDNDRRRRRHIDAQIFPGNATVLLIECNKRLSLTAKRQYHGVLVSQWTAGIPSVHLSAVVLFPEIVEPADLSGSLVDGVKFSCSAYCEDKSSRQERRGMWSKTFSEIHARGGSFIPVFPNSLSCICS